jgi:hypothetical protein
MLDYAEPVTRLIDELKRLPGIGHKSAQRVAFHLLKASLEETDRLVVAIRDVKDRLFDLQQSDRYRSLPLLQQPDPRPVDHLCRRGALQPRRHRKDA